MSEDGVTRSAILLMSLGEEGAVEVFKHLGPREVQKLGIAMAKLSNVTRDQVAGVLREFHEEAQQHTSIASEPEENAIGVEDLFTTVYHCLGIVADQELMAPGDRPIEICDGGKSPA